MFDGQKIDSPASWELIRSPGPSRHGNLGAFCSHNYHSSRRWPFRNGFLTTASTAVTAQPQPAEAPNAPFPFCLMEPVS